MKNKNYYFNKSRTFLVELIIIILIFTFLGILTANIYTSQKKFVTYLISTNNAHLERDNNILHVRFSSLKRAKSHIFNLILLIISTSLFGILLFIFFIIREKRRLVNDSKYILKFLNEEENFGKNIDLEKIFYYEFSLIAEHFNKLFNENSIKYIQIVKNQRNLENIFNSMTDGVFIYDVDGKIINVNDTILEMYGLKNREELKKYDNFRNLSSDKNDLSKIKEYCKTAIQGKSIQFEWLGRNIKLGKDFDILVSLTKIIYKNQPAILATVKDISKIIEIRKKLQDKKELFQTTLRSISDCVIRTDLDFRIKFINPACEKIINKKFEEVKNSKFHDVFNILEENESISYCIEKIISNDKSIYNKNLILEDWQKNKLNIELSSSLINDSKNVTIGILFVIRDITEKLKYKNEIAKRKNLESLGILASGIAHGFNNILTGVYGNISLAKYVINDDRAKSYLSAAEDSIEKAKFLSSKLLTFAEGDKSILEVVNLNKIIDKMGKYILNNYNTIIEYYEDDDLWHILADKNQIEQVFTNLLENACESTSEDKENKIIIKTNNFDNTQGLLDELDLVKYVKIEIEDKGKGIKGSDLRKIFDPYYTTKFLGRGLGLAIVYSIIEKHGGKIFVSSKEGYGSKFTIYLPTSNIKTDKIKKKRKYNILLMEEHRTISEINKKILERIGYNVVIAIKSLELLKICQIKDNDNKIDLIILGLGYGENIDKLNFLEEIYKVFPEIKIIVSVYKSDIEKLKNLFKFRINSLIFKPYIKEEIAATIEKTMTEIEGEERLEAQNNFKTCSFCGQKWETREDFLKDSGIKLIGYQINYIEHEKGLFLFNHSCNTTLSCPVNEFSDLYKGIKYTENKMGTPECKEYCIQEDNLEDCGNHCIYNWIRKVMEIITHYEENKID